MSETVSLAVELQSPIDRVWRALTDEAQLSQWTLFQVSGFQPVVGHRFRLLSPTGPGWDGVITCEVLTVDAPHRIAYTWAGGPAGLEIETTVTWTLQEVSPGVTRLQLEQQGFSPDAKQASGGARYGWTRMLEQLQALLQS